MVTVKDLIGVKTDASRYAVKANESVYRAIRLMADRRIGAVLVVENGIVIGIFTERDYIMRVEVEGRAAKETTLREVMTDQREPGSKRAPAQLASRSGWLMKAGRNLSLTRRRNECDSAAHRGAAMRSHGRAV